MINTREPDFYERNKDRAVNLYVKDTTLSGDITKYDRDKGIAVLSKHIIRRYNPDGTSEFVESGKGIEIDTGIINIREETTREDRLGRIVKYNRDLKIEEKERRKKLRKE